MRTTNFQELIREERWAIIDKFQKKYPTKKAREKALAKMEDRDINILCYCANQIQACIYYSSFKNKKRD